MDSFEGHIQLIIGPMFAGKTSELLRRLRRYKVAKKRCLVLKYKGDVRYSDTKCSTHDLVKVPAESFESLFDAANIVDSYDVIGIDEGQFFPDLIPFCENMANSGKIVIVAALDATFQRKPFGDVVSLIPKAEMVTKLSAVCMICAGDAHFSKRISSESDVKVIGGSDKYISVCRACFFHDMPEGTKTGLETEKVVRKSSSGKLSMDMPTPIRC